MAKCTSTEHNFHKTPNMYPDLSANISNDQQFRLTKINEIKDYFIVEIRERELMRKNPSKYIASFVYLDNSLFYLEQLVVFLLRHLQQLSEHL